LSFFSNNATWSLVALKDIATLKRGYDLPTNSRVQGEIPIYAANGPNGTHNEAKFAGPGVITGRSGTIGRVHFTESAYWPLNTALYVTDFHGNDPKWVFYMLKAFKLERFVQGAGVPTLNRNLVHGELIPLPPLDEQKRIATILDKADAIRCKRQQAIQLADDLLRSVFLDMFGDPMVNPKHWRVEPWSEVLKITNGKNQKSVLSPDGQYPIMGSGGEMGRANDYLSPENSIIIGRKGNINKPILVKEKYWNVDTAFGLVADENQLSFNYLYWFCIFFDFERLNKTVTIPSLTKADLLEIKIPVPDMEKQKEFDAMVNKLSVMNSKYSQFKRSASESFNSLSQKAFSGQL
jgi:type I restriction enzyme S subunit